VAQHAEKWDTPIPETPKGRRDGFVELYFRAAAPDQVIVILKAREPARIMTTVGDRKTNPGTCRSDVPQPYLPFSARVYLNQYRWLAIQVCEEGIDFEQWSNPSGT